MSTDKVTIRPCPLRVAALTAFCLLGLWPVLTPGAPLLVRVIGAATLLAAPLVVVLGVRTRVVLAGDTVDVTMPFRPIAFGATTPLRPADGRRVDVPLVLFSKRDQAVLAAHAADGGVT